MASLLEMVRLVLLTFPQVLVSLWALLLLMLALLLVFRQYRRIAAMEQELFGVALHPPGEQTRQSLLVGLFGGIVGSLILSLAGVGLVDVTGAASALLYLWPTAILLGAINPRFLCFAYGGSLLSLSHLIFGWPRIDVPSVMGLVAVLHMVEALMIRASGASCATPMSVAGRRPEPVPGFMLQRFWPVPLVLPLFSDAAGLPLQMPQWWPLLRPDALLMGDAAFYGWSLLPAVVTMGYSDLAITAPPAVRARYSGRVLLAYSGILLVLAVLGAHFRPVLWLAALFSALGHEIMAVWSGRVQLLGIPFLQRPARGVALLDILPGSVAAAGGLRSGSVVLTVEDAEVHSREELHAALLGAPSYVRVMFRNGRQLEHCRVPRPPEGLFGFGAILLPEPGELPLARLRRPSFFRLSRLEK